MMIGKDEMMITMDKKSPRSHSRPYYTPHSRGLMHTDDVSASKEGAHDTYDF